MVKVIFYGNANDINDYTIVVQDGKYTNDYHITPEQLITGEQILEILKILKDNTVELVIKKMM